MLSFRWLLARTAMVRCPPWLVCQKARISNAPSEASRARYSSAAALLGRATKVAGLCRPLSIVRVDFGTGHCLNADEPLLSGGGYGEGKHLCRFTQSVAIRRRHLVGRGTTSKKMLVMAQIRWRGFRKADRMIRVVESEGKGLGLRVTRKSMRHIKLQSDGSQAPRS